MAKGKPGKRMKLSPTVARRRAQEAPEEAATAAATGHSAQHYVSTTEGTGSGSVTQTSPDQTHHEMANFGDTGIPPASDPAPSPLPKRPAWRGHTNIYEPYKYPHYTPELAGKICHLIAHGHSVRAICERPGMPNCTSIYTWLHKHDDFRKQYLISRQITRDRLDDEILEIIDDTSKDIVALKDRDGLERQVLNPVAVQRAKARVLARQRMLERHKAMKHDPRFDEDGNPSGMSAAMPAAPPANILTEERRQKLIERRRAAIEANLKAAGETGRSNSLPA